MSLNARGGGGGGGMTAEQRAEQAADNAKPQPMLNGLSRDQFFKLSPEEQNAARAQADIDNPKTATAFNAIKFIASPVKYLYDKLAPPPAASEMQKYIDAADAESRTLTRDRAFTAAPVQTQTPYSPSELAGAEMRDAEGRNPANFSDAPVSAAEAEASQRTVDSLGKSNRAAEFGGQTTGLPNGSYTTSLSLPSYAKGDETQLAGDVKDGTVKLGDKVSFDGKPYTVSESDGAIRLTQEGIQGAPALSSSAPASTAAAVPNINPVDPYAVDSDYTTDKNITYTAAEQARIDRDAAMRSLQMAIERESPDSIAKYQAQVNDLNNKLAALNGEPSAVAQTNAALTPAETTPFNAFDFSGPTETAIQTAAQKDRIEAAREASIRADREAEAAKAEAARAYSPSELAGTSALNSAYGVADAKGDAYGGKFSTNAAYSPSELAGQSIKDSIDRDFSPPTSGYSTVETQPIAAPDISLSVPGAISADPNADKKVETLNIPDAATFAAMIGSPFAQTAALNTGVVSDAGNGLAGIPAPNMGNSRGLAAIGGLGNVWRNAEGTPWRTGDGTSLQTGNAAEAQRQQDAIDSQVLAEARQANPDPNPGHDIVGPGGYSNSLTTWGGGGGSEAATGGLSTPYGFEHMARGGNVRGNMRPPAPFFQNGKYSFHPPQMYADGGELDPYNLGSYSDGGRLLKGPGDGVSDSIPATIGKGRPARLADGEFVIPARIVSEIGNGSTEAGARKLYAMMDRIQAGRKKSVGKGKVAVNSRADKYLPA